MGVIIALLWEVNVVSRLTHREHEMDAGVCVIILGIIFPWKENLNPSAPIG